MLTTTLDTSSLKAVTKVIEELGFNVRKELKIAVSKTSKQVRIKSARKLRIVLPAPVKVLKKAVIGGKSSNEGLSQEVVLWQGHPIPLKYLGARQNKKGVTYKTGNKTRGFVKSAFVVDRFGRNVFARTGAARVPIEKQFGPSPGEMYQVGGVTQVAIQTAEEQLPKQINERIRFLTIKAQGKLKK